MGNLANFIKMLWRNSRNNKVKCFTDNPGSKSISLIDRGLCSVPLNHIVGSVDRCHDFDGQFKLKRDMSLDRFLSIERAMREHKKFPPVKLYKVKEEYYVLDGNHRVSAAKKIGLMKTIKALVMEFNPDGNTRKIPKEKNIGHTATYSQDHTR